MILLDTHVLIWLDSGNRRLGQKARRQIDDAYRVQKLAVSSISFWETAMLLDRDRIELAAPPLVWRQDLLAAGLVEIELTGETGVMAATLEGFHGDPADRMITATAIRHDAVLVTADEKILAWTGALERLDARR